MPGDTTSIPTSSGLQVPQPGYATVPTQTRPLQAADYGPMLQAIEMAGKNIMNSDLNPENFAKARANIAAANVVPDVISAYRNAPGGSLLPYVTNIQGNVPQIGFAGLPAGTAQLIAQRMGLIPQTPGGNGGGKKEVAPGTGREGGEESPNATEEQKTPEDKSKAASMGVTDNNPQGNALATGVGQQGLGIAATALGAAPNKANAASMGTSNVPVQQNAGLAQAAGNVGAGVNPQALADAQSGLSRYYAASGAFGGVTAPSVPVPVDPSRVANMPPQDTRNMVASTDNDQLLRYQAQQDQAQQQAQEQAKQQQLQQWQNQNVHPVITAPDALKWAQARDTSWKHAYVSDTGGPGGSPAVTFTDTTGKKSTTVPVDQIARNGGGPLIASQNISHVLSATAGGAGASGAQPQQPQPQNQGPESVGVQPQGGGPTNVPQGPPAAPGGAPPEDRFSVQPGQLPADEFQRRVAAATNVPTAGGPPPANMIAQVGNNNGGHYSNGSTTDENGIAKAGNGDGGVNQSGTGLQFVRDTTGLTPEILDKLKNQPRDGETNPFYAGDPKAFQYGGWKWYEDDGTGKYYTLQGGQQLFYQGRLYFGDDQYRQFALPQMELAKNLHGLEPQIPVDELTNPRIWPRDRLVSELNKITQSKLLGLKDAVPEGVTNNIDHTAKEIQSMTRLENAITGLPPENYNDLALLANRSRATGENLKDSPGEGPIGSAGGTAGKVFTWLGGGTGSDKRLNYIEKERDGLKALMSGVSAGGENEKIQYEGLMKLWGTPDFPAALHHYIQMRQVDFRRAVIGASQNNQRVPAYAGDMADQILMKQPWSDPTDDYGPGKNVPKGPLQTQYDNLPESQKHPNNPSPTPYVRH